MVTTGDLSVGTRLPTVRQLSRSLGVSPTTVGEAWRTLADVGAIETLGRNGTFVRQPTGPGGPRRYRRIAADWDHRGHFSLDLSAGTPDSAVAAQGIGAAPGEPFMVFEHPDALRVTVGLLGPGTDIVGVAEAVASAAVSSGEARRGQR